MNLTRVYKEIDDGAQRAENTRPLSGKTGALPSTRKSLLQRFKVWTPIITATRAKLWTSTPTTIPHPDASLTV